MSTSASAVGSGIGSHPRNFFSVIIKKMTENKRHIMTDNKILATTWTRNKTNNNDSAYSVTSLLYITV